MGIKKPNKASEKSGTFTKDEVAAMRERARELKEEARMSSNKAAGERAVLAKIGKLKEPDRSMAKKIHAIIKAEAPQLYPKTWYGMPAYAAPDGIVICFFTPAAKFKSRYATFGFNDAAHLDNGHMWAVSYALKRLTKAEEKQIRALVQKATRK